MSNACPQSSLSTTNRLCAKLSPDICDKMGSTWTSPRTVPRHPVCSRAWPDLVLLELMLPGIDGIEVCSRMRAQSNVPVIMVTAKEEESDTNIGLGVVADDHVSKQLSPRELVARVKGVLRRVKTPIVAGMPARHSSPPAASC